MRPFSALVATLLVLAVGIGWTAAAVEGPFPLIYHYEQRGEVEVITSLAAYLFSIDEAELRSVYLYYETWGAAGGELMPGTTTSLVQVDPDAIGDSVPILKEDRPILRRLMALRLSFPLNSFIAQREFAPGASYPFAFDGQDAPFTLSRAEIREDGIAVIEFSGAVAGVNVVKRFLIEDTPYYTVDVEIETTNPGTEDVELRMSGAGSTPGDRGPTLVYLFDGVRSEIARERATYARFEGLGLVSKGTVLFLASDGSAGLAPFVTPTTDVSARFGVTWAAAPGTQTQSFKLYGGRRRFLLMEAAGLEEVDDPGTMARLIVPVVRFLNLLYRTTGNFGWAIILFTILTRVLLYPLMRKQYHSMARMQKLQPKLKKIQERYRDDRQLQQQKLMEMYKREGVNPLGGCLPMLVQLPLLVLLWRAIFYSSEQMHLSPGFLWLADLSVRDPYYILVILTTAVMLIQQRMMTPMSADAGGSSKLMGYIFPLFMAVFFASFPAGLWLYYFLTTVLQVGQQAIVNWEIARSDTGAAAVGEPIGDAEEEQGEEADDQREAGDGQG
ncbi:MAG: membrane protein insertase YidC [Candidatus Bipolaricaulota bacterium]|nr:MAG: membrane protein insertase YidC [Candidatus Bipolaricaulota bacterium]